MRVLMFTLITSHLRLRLICLITLNGRDAGACLIFAQCGPRTTDKKDRGLSA